MKKLLFIVNILVVSFQGFAQEKVLSVKLNTMINFSKPALDLANDYKRNHALQPYLEVEISKHLFDYLKSRQLGVRVAGTYNVDYGNFLKLTYDKLLKTKTQAYGVRIYPISSKLSNIDAITNFKFQEKNFSLFGSYAKHFIYFFTLNSLHFDYRTGNMKLSELDYLDEEPIGGEISRNVSYLGWGLQPQIYTSENKKWIFNLQLDFGEYQWENNAGNNSAIKYNYVGFGVQHVL